MIHPHTELRFISEHVGYGVFATQIIPMGTMVYVKDQLDIGLTAEEVHSLHPEMQAMVEKYSYIDEHGTRVVSWDHAKYVNHCCNCNTLSTGYGFEIALRDILPGEEITDEYGLFNLDQPMQLHCAQPNCRGRVVPRDFELWADTWDQWAMEALRFLPLVRQPLYFLLDCDTRNRLEGYLSGQMPYISVRCLRQSPETTLNDPNVAA